MYNPDLRILYVISHCPYAPSYGSQLRVLHIGKLLGRLGKVSLVMARNGEIDAASLERTRQEFDLRRIVRLVPAHIRKPADRFRYELDPGYLNTQGVTVARADRENMLRLIEEHDVVWLHTIHTANVFQIYRWPRSILDIDDIQSRYFSSLARAELHPVRKLLDYRRSRIWERRERILKDRFDVLCVVSEHDRKYLEGNGQVEVVPNGFTAPADLPLREPAVPPRIGFIGTLRWFPNREGVEWFIRKVWSEVKAEVPSARLRLVGEASEAYFPDLGADIDGLGWVADPGAEIASWSAMVVPVRVGAGTRVKIAEAFSRKCPVIATPLGAFGYEVIQGEDLLLADRARDFASACVFLIKNPDRGLRLAENAWRKFLKNWTWESIGVSVSRAIHECLRRAGPRVSAGVHGNGS